MTSFELKPDRDQNADSELRRVREQLFALAEVAREYREVVLWLFTSPSKTGNAPALLKADTALRDALAIVARMKRFQ